MAAKKSKEIKKLVKYLLRFRGSIGVFRDSLAAISGAPFFIYIERKKQ